MPTAAKTYSSLRPQTRLPDNRPSAHRRGYDAKWQRFRKAYLAKHPLCIDCESHGYTVLSKEVHHIKPLDKRPDLKYAEDNLEALCHDCHNLKTQRARFDTIGHELKEVV